MLSGVWKNGVSRDVLQASRNDDGTYDVQWIYLNNNEQPFLGVQKFTAAQLYRKIRQFELRKEEMYGKK